MAREWRRGARYTVTDTSLGAPATTSSAAAASGPNPARTIHSQCRRMMELIARDEGGRQRDFAVCRHGHRPLRRFGAQPHALLALGGDSGIAPQAALQHLHHHL